MTRSIASVGRTFNIPLKAMELMVKKGILGSKEIAPDDEAWFVVLGQIWGDTDFIKIQVDDLDDKEIKKVLKPAKASPVDTYILTRFREKKSGVKILTDDLAVEVKSKFGCAINASLFAKINKLRNQVKNAKRTSSNKKK